MKCSNCGFTYDDEAVCPICGVPAESKEQAVPYFVNGEPVVSNEPAAEKPKAKPKSKPKKAEKKPAPAKKKSGKGLKIATFCVLSIIAAALITSVVFQAASFNNERKYYKKAMKAMDRDEQAYDEINNYNEFSEKSEISEKFETKDKDYYPDDNGNIIEEPDGNDYQGQTAFADNVTHKIGESYDFGKGKLTLKSVSKAGNANFDSSQQQVVFRLEITNNTDSEQTYEAAEMTLGDEAFNAEHFAYYEDDNKTDDVWRSVSPGETIATVFCYNLPKTDQALTCEVHMLGGDGEYTATTKYGFDTKELK